MKIGITYDVHKVDGERAKKFNDCRKIEDIHCIKKELEKIESARERQAERRKGIFQGYVEESCRL